MRVLFEPRDIFLVPPFAPEDHVPVFRREKVWWYFTKRHTAVDGSNIGLCACSRSRIASSTSHRQRSDCRPNSVALCSGQERSHTPQSDLEASSTNNLSFQGSLKSANTEGKRMAPIGAHAEHCSTTGRSGEGTHQQSRRRLKASRDMDVATKTRKRSAPRRSDAPESVLGRRASSNSKIYHPYSSILYTDAPMLFAEGEAQEFIF